jgi:hypothetical protein
MSCPIIVPSLPAGYDLLQPALGTKVCMYLQHDVHLALLHNEFLRTVASFLFPYLFNVVLQQHTFHSDLRGHDGKRPRPTLTSSV